MLCGPATKPSIIFGAVKIFDLETLLTILIMPLLLSNGNIYIYIFLKDDKKKKKEK